MKQELISILSRLLELLQSHSVRYAIVVENYLKRLKAANTDEELLVVSTEIKKQMLGGMGSLNDVWISHENGHIVSDEKAANSALEQLRDKLRHVLLSKQA